MMCKMLNDVLLYESCDSWGDVTLDTRKWDFLGARRKLNLFNIDQLSTQSNSNELNWVKSDYWSVPPHHPNPTPRGVIFLKN